MSRTFLILGGYGNTGTLISEFLLKYTDSKLILAGRNQLKAEKTSHTLNEKYFDDRVSPVGLNTSNKKVLSSKFESADMVIVASSSGEDLHNIAEACINAGTDYYDLQMSSPQKFEKLKSYEKELKDRNLYWVTDGGFHPGVPAILIRYAAKHFDKMEIANVGSLVNINWNDIELSDSTITEFVNEIKNYQPLAYRDNDWKKIRSRNYMKFDFDENSKGKVCAPLMLEEMRILPDHYSNLRECGFYISGFNTIVDYFILPAGYIGMNTVSKLVRKPLEKSLKWGLKRFTKPPYRTVIIASTIGRRNNLTKEVKIKLSHSDGYWLTGAAVTAFLFQYLRGNFSAPGLYLQALAAEPATFLKDLETLGVHVTINT